MCRPFDYLPWGYRRVERPVIRRKRIYAFAADRYVDATSPGAVAFWRAIMDACVGTESDVEPIPGFFETLRARGW